MSLRWLTGVCEVEEVNEFSATLLNVSIDKWISKLQRIIMAVQSFCPVQSDQTVNESLTGYDSSLN